MAVDKQSIMEKLFSEKPLTNEEILHIGSKLDDEIVVEKEGELKNKKTPYDHTITDSLSRACGLSDSDFDNVNKLIRSEITEKQKNGEIDCDSKQVEIMEKIALTKPSYLRLMLYHYIKLKAPKSGSGVIRFGGPGGGGSGGLGDFLDFLRSQGL